MTLRQVLRDNVKFYRKELKLSQEKLAELSNLGTKYIDDIESIFFCIQNVKNKCQSKNYQFFLNYLQHLKIPTTLVENY